MDYRTTENCFEWPRFWLNVKPNDDTIYKYYGIRYHHRFYGYIQLNYWELEKARKTYAQMLFDPEINWCMLLEQHFRRNRYTTRTKKLASTRTRK